MEPDTMRKIIGRVGALILLIRSTYIWSVLLTTDGCSKGSYASICVNFFNSTDLASTLEVAWICLSIIFLPLVLYVFGMVFFLWLYKEVFFDLIEWCNPESPTVGVSKYRSVRILSFIWKGFLWVLGNVWFLVQVVIAATIVLAWPLSLSLAIAVTCLYYGILDPMEKLGEYF